MTACTQCHLGAARGGSALPVGDRSSLALATRPDPYSRSCLPDTQSRVYSARLDITPLFSPHSCLRERHGHLASLGLKVQARRVTRCEAHRRSHPVNNCKRVMLPGGHLPPSWGAFPVPQSVSSPATTPSVFLPHSFPEKILAAGGEPLPATGSLQENPQQAVHGYPLFCKHASLFCGFGKQEVLLAPPRRPVLSHCR